MKTNSFIGFLILAIVLPGGFIIVPVFMLLLKNRNKEKMVKFLENFKKIVQAICACIGFPILGLLGLSLAPIWVLYLLGETLFSNIRGKYRWYN